MCECVCADAGVLCAEALTQFYLHDEWPFYKRYTCTIYPVGDVHVLSIIIIVEYIFALLAFACKIMNASTEIVGLMYNSAGSMSVPVDVCVQFSGMRSVYSWCTHFPSKLDVCPT